MSYWFLASPYTHEHRIIRVHRYEIAKTAAAWCFQNGVLAYSPIVYTHLISVEFDLPIPYQFWREHNHAMITGSCGLLILKIDGYDRSKGITDEVDFAKRIGRKGYGISFDGHSQFAIDWDKPFW
jgi:hypothetical protein